MTGVLWETRAQQIDVSPPFAENLDGFDGVIRDPVLMLPTGL